MKSFTFKQYCITHEVKAVSPVRKNTNGYHYLTLLSDKFEGGASNIYFSKNQSAKVSEGQEAKALNLGTYNIVLTDNAAGEERLKLTTTQYASVEDLF